MKLWSRNMLWKILVLALLLNPGGLAAQEPAAAPSTAQAPTLQPDVPHLADLIPQATALIDRFAKLETVLKSGPDPSEVQNKLLEIDSTLKKYAGKLQKIHKRLVNTMSGLIGGVIITTATVVNQSQYAPRF